MTDKTIEPRKLQELKHDAEVKEKEKGRATSLTHSIQRLFDEVLVGLHRRASSSAASHSGRQLQDPGGPGPAGARAKSANSKGGNCINALRRVFKKKSRSQPPEKGRSLDRGRVGPNGAYQSLSVNLRPQNAPLGSCTFSDG